MKTDTFRFLPVWNYLKACNQIKHLGYYITSYWTMGAFIDRAGSYINLISWLINLVCVVNVMTSLF